MQGTGGSQEINVYQPTAYLKGCNVAGLRFCAARDSDEAEVDGSSDEAEVDGSSNADAAGTPSGSPDEEDDGSPGFEF
eukprot:gene19372-28686_t